MVLGRPTPLGRLIELMLNAEEEKEIHEWLSRAMVVAPIGVSSLSQLVSTLEEEGLSVVQCCQIGDNPFLVTLADKLEVRKSLDLASNLFRIIG